MSDYTVKTLDEIEGAFGGAFKRVRAALGCTSFGMQVIEMPPGWDGYPNHDHAGDGQEEVYLALKGSGELDIEGKKVQLGPETFVRVGPGSKRKITPGPEGLRLLAIGGVPGGTFKAHPVTELGGPEELPKP